MPKASAAKITCVTCSRRRRRYRKILKRHWRPKFGKREFLDIKASELKTFIGSAVWDSKKTRNNVVSVGRRVFEFGYDDHPAVDNPAERTGMPLEIRGVA